jgi:glycerol uptake facilitator-like aquaporin
MRPLAAEALGTSLLLAVVIGSGIMGERLAGGNAALALLANAIATGCGLAVLIAIFAPVSGAHFNPCVTLSMAWRGDFPWRGVIPYVAIQLVSAVAGVLAAHYMFGEPLLNPSVKARAGVHQLWSEFVATFGLMLVIWGCVRQKLAAAPFLIAAYITAAYWFTASTSFANPAVTIARSLSDTFAGIRPGDVPGFIAAELAGAAVGTWVSSWLFRTDPVTDAASPPPRGKAR